MIKIGILGAIGSGKSFVAERFGYPVFSADKEVAKLYREDKKIYKKLNKELPKYFASFPIDKTNVINAILENKSNLKKIIKIVHKEIRKKMNLFIKKNKNKKIIILDIPLLLENNLNDKKNLLIFVQAKRNDILKRLKIRKNYNKKIFNKFSNIQLPLNYKKKKSDYIIINNFKEKTVKNKIKIILNKIL